MALVTSHSRAKRRPQQLESIVSGMDRDEGLAAGRGQCHSCAALALPTLMALPLLYAFLNPLRAPLAQDVAS